MKTIIAAVALLAATAVPAGAETLPVAQGGQGAALISQIEHVMVATRLTRNADYKGVTTAEVEPLVDTAVVGRQGDALTHAYGGVIAVRPTADKRVFELSLGALSSQGCVTAVGAQQVEGALVGGKAFDAKAVARGEAARACASKADASGVVPAVSLRFR